MGLEHSHPHSLDARGTGRATLAQAFGLTALILAAEVGAALWSHSLALLADAGHMVTDVAALGLAWFALRQAERPADERRTYGYQRAGILAALANAAVLIVVVVAIGYEAVRRLAHPQAVDGRVVALAALLALITNGYIASRLHAGGDDLNVRAAMLHVLGDLAASAGVLAAGAVIWLTGWLPADPLVSIGVAVLIAVGALRLVLDTTHILLEGAPRNLDVAELRREIHLTDGVAEVHDLHVWSLSGTESALSAHVVAARRDLSGEDAEHLVRSLEQRLCDRFGIGHTTIQVEVCHPCQEEAHGPGAPAHNHPHPAAP